MFDASINTLTGSRNAAKLIVISYSQSSADELDSASNAINAEQLHAQLSWIKNRFDVLPVGSAVERCRSGQLVNPTASIIVECMRINILVIYRALLNNLNIPATLCLANDSASRGKSESGINVADLENDKKEVLSLVKDGFELGGYIRFNSSDSTLDRESINAKLIDLKNILKQYDINSLNCLSFSGVYPHEAINNEVLKVIMRHGISSALIDVVGHYAPGRDPLQIPKITLDGAVSSYWLKQIREALHCVPKTVKSRGY